MKRFVQLAVLIPVVALLLISCATLAEKKKIDRFEEKEGAYRQALMASDFLMAARYVDPTIERREMDPDQYALIKIVDYKPVHVDVSKDMLRIEQRVMLKYFALNINRLHTIQYQQVWHFDEVHKTWLLQTELPALNP